MLKVEYTTQFKRDLKLSKRRNGDEGKLEIKLKDHALAGNWVGHRELHIIPI